MDRPVFVLLTAVSCPGCMNFKANVWPSLKASLVRGNRVQIVEIEIADTRSKPDPIKYHKDFGRFIGWFPTMSLFPADRWFNHSSDLIGIIKNGKIVPPSKNVDGKIIPEHVEQVGTMNLSENDILKWVDYTLDNPEGMFKINPNNFKKTDTTPVMKLNDGKIKVPTRGYYATFERSKVE